MSTRIGSPSSQGPSPWRLIWVVMRREMALAVPGRRGSVQRRLWLGSWVSEAGEVPHGSRLLRFVGWADQCRRPLRIFWWAPRPEIAAKGLRHRPDLGTRRCYLTNERAALRVPGALLSPSWPIEVAVPRKCFTRRVTEWQHTWLAPLTIAHSTPSTDPFQA